MKTKHKMHRGFTLVELLVVIVIIAALAGLTAPQVIKMKKKGDLAEATSNARQLGLGLTQFDADVGGYPDDDSVEAVEALTGESSSVKLNGTNSNDYFRQLVVSGVVDSEQPFFARTTYIKSKPDDLMKGNELLKAGEVGFGYIMKSQGKAIPVGAGKPVAAAPLKENSSGGEMETDPYDGKAIVLFADSSVKQLNIRTKDSKAMLQSKKHILEGGSEDSVWGTDVTPVMVSPQTK
jgi:prepilin-type N-terminal cleavage/methylation domain-containing protein